MERYSEYKDSGVQWLGEIPNHWKLLHLRNFLTLFSEKGFPDSPLLSVTREKGVILRDKDNKEENHNYVPEDLSGYKHLNVGDFVINKMKSWQGSYGVSDYEGIVSPAYFTCKLRGVIPSFFSMAIRSVAYIGFFMQYSKGIRVDQWDLDPNSMKDIPFVLPPTEEQTCIVTYLNEVTKKIDKAIAQQQKMVDLLNERKQIIINHAVTKGLNPDVSMKDSGVEWMGQIPEHWEQLPLKYVFEIRNGYTPSKNDKSYWTNGTIPWYRMEDIRKSGRILNESIQYVTHKAVNGKGLFKAGSYIMAICTASIGEHAMLIADSLANQQFANFNIRKSLVEDFVPMFLFYFMYVVGDFCRNNANSTCFQYIDMEALKRFPILKPSKEEQKCIVAYLDKGLKKLNTALEQTKTRIALLQERKQIIINEVVTGKVKVS